MGSFDNNPFDRTALTEYRLLAGRTDEFRKIRAILRNSSKNRDRVKSVLLSGSRGVGKTSFLNLISNECIDNNLIPIRINLTSTNSDNLNEFFWYLFSQTMNAMYALDLFEGKGGAVDLTIQKILHSDGIQDHANWIFRSPILRKNYLTINSNFEFDSFAEDLKLIRESIKGSGGFDEKTKILFLVDESQNIYSNSQIIESIRYIIQNSNLGVGFIFAGDNTFETSTWETVFGGSYREFDVINLNYFTDVNDVIEYFKKSLDSIGWTTNEIEETLFYRFKLTCRQIFQLTSGNPAWINIIAAKMFERCSNGETSMLRFDRLVQKEVQYLLENSGQLDRSKLDIIDNLKPKLKLWLAEIFSSEFSYLEQVYFYTKFKLSGDNFLTIDDFKGFCLSLLKNKIIVFFKDEDIDFDSPEILNEILNKRYFAFGLNSDTIKQWLQISTDGKFRFSFTPPDRRFIEFLNSQVVTEVANTSIFDAESDDIEDGFRLSKVIDEINNDIFDVNNKSYELVLMTYRACKRLSESRQKQSLFIKLMNNISEKLNTWNVYNYDDKGRFIDYSKSSFRIDKIKSVIESYNNENESYSLELFVDNLNSPDLKKLQNQILTSPDKKKLGILLDDKDSDLVESYLKDSDMESSYLIASFFYELFEEGLDLNVRNLSNSAYVFIVNNEIEKALKMLNQAVQSEIYGSFNLEQGSAADLALYNLGIVNFIREDYSKAIENFEKVIKLYDDHSKFEGSAGALQVLDLDSDHKIILKEVKGEDGRNRVLSCKEFAQQNLTILNNR